MISVDTNIFARIFLRDNPHMNRIALELLMTEELFVPKSVAVESYWLLRKRGGYSRVECFRFLRWAAGQPSIILEDGEAFVDALETEDAGLEFDDALHIASSFECEGFATFDEDLNKRARFTKLIAEVFIP